MNNENSNNKFNTCKNCGSALPSSNVCVSCGLDNNSNNLNNIHSNDISNKFNKFENTLFSVINIIFIIFTIVTYIGTFYIFSQISLLGDSFADISNISLSFSDILNCCFISAIFAFVPGIISFSLSFINKNKTLIWSHIIFFGAHLLLIFI